MVFGVAVMREPSWMSECLTPMHPPTETPAYLTATGNMKQRKSVPMSNEFWRWNTRPSPLSLQQGEWPSNVRPSVRGWLPSSQKSGINLTAQPYAGYGAASLLRSAVQCIRGACSSRGYAPIDLVSSEAHLVPR